MKEHISTLEQWQEAGRSFKIARVIQTWGSSPKPVGSSMLIADNLEMIGSVSGGCVEGAVLKEAQSLEAGIGKILDYGVSDDEAWAVGLTCGGKLKVYLQSWDSPEAKELGKKLSSLLEKNQACALISKLGDTSQNLNALIAADGTLVSGEVPPAVIDEAKRILEMRKNEMISIEGNDYFVHAFPSRSRLVIIGAAHITVDLVMLARQFDFETFVIDPRGTFVDKTIFNEKPDHLIEKYPSEVLHELALDTNCYTVILSHDPKIDDDALKIILKTSVAYVGALGSRKNQEKRVARLREYGFDESQISQIEAPIGVDINAKGAKEIALSIMAGIIKAKNRFL